MVDFVPGMRTVIRDEEWMVKKIETNSLGNKTLYYVDVSLLVKDRKVYISDIRLRWIRYFTRLIRQNFLCSVPDKEI